MFNFKSNSDYKTKYILRGITFQLLNNQFQFYLWNLRIISHRHKISFFFGYSLHSGYLRFWRVGKDGLWAYSLNEIAKMYPKQERQNRLLKVELRWGLWLYDKRNCSVKHIFLCTTRLFNWKCCHTSIRKHIEHICENWGRFRIICHQCLYYF